MSIVKFLWLGYLVVVLFFRYSFEGRIIIFIYSILIVFVTVINALQSRNEWREIAQEFHDNLERDETN